VALTVSGLSAIWAAVTVRGRSRAGGSSSERHGRQVKELIGGIEYWIREGHPSEGRRPVERGQEKPTDWGLTA
jgi:hypothetical protein